MARPRNFDEAEVLEGAVKLFREQGYDNTSVPQLIEKLGICRQSLYKEYGDKRGLYLRALERWGKREIDSKLNLLSSEGSPFENVLTVVRGWAAYASQCPGGGCLTVTAIVETRDDKDALAIVEKQVERFEQGFLETLTKAKELGEIKANASPERLARTLISSCYGIGVLNRLAGSAPRIRDTVSLLLEVLNNARAN